MLSGHIAYHLGKHDGSAQDGKTLLQNTSEHINIAKQLLSILNAGEKTHIAAEELETMLADHEFYWSDRSGRRDIDAEKAGVLPVKIVWITSQLIETMKS